VKIKRLAAAAAPVGAAVLAASYVAAPPADAAALSVGKELCANDLCVQTIGMLSDAYACIDLWAFNQTFYGHFELSVSNTFVSNTNNSTFVPGEKVEFYWGYWNGANIVAKEWKDVNGHYTEIAHVSFGVNPSGLNKC
jgi:hypothetical protein